ncbi:hypothetical protein PUNSTDRAFT_23942, partial [Punctularia strigosozonata HHB-11173 SS5]|uniref:uncharacterized protein n=1 Tax=Punctularia strigosozonata (strain HHB-11173) TaxID=741275 RepID=UPI0004417F33
QRYKIRSDNLELITLLVCCAADGTTAKTTFVLSDGPYPNICVSESFISVAVTPSGWTDQDVAADWIANVFIPAVRIHSDITKPILLF